MKECRAIILAAGKGKRMKSKQYKVLHEVCGKPLVKHVIEQLHNLSVNEIFIIVGHGAESVKQECGPRYHYVFQEEQLGTGHACLQSAHLLEHCDGTTFILCGDTPLITSKTLENLLAYHHENNNAATLLTAIFEQPTGYGRIVREHNSVARIIEEKDATADEKLIKEINTGFYCFDNRSLFQALKKINNDNAQGEYYLTDVIGVLSREGYAVGAFVTDDPSETIGINDRVALAEAEQIMKNRIIKNHMLNGVTVVDPNNTYIGSDVTIGQDTVIYPGTFLRGHTVIKENCIIGPHADIDCCEIADRVEVKHSVLVHAKLDGNAVVGPFAYIRPGSTIGEEAKVGDFVEIKNSKLGKGTKVSHLSYIGDSDLGEDVNIGCGTVTVNYDGVNKYRTTIKDRAFIGCNTNLIAPVTVGEGAYIAAGSTITKDIPDHAFAIARERETIKPNYVEEKIKNKPKVEAPQ